MALDRRAVCLGLWLLSSLPAGAQTFSDEFSTAGDRLERSRWTTEFFAAPPACNASFLGRTQLRDWVRPDGIGRFVVEDGAARLALDTYNPTSPPSNPSLFGTHAKTGTYNPAAETTFVPSETTDVVLAIRMRLTSLQRGIVYGVYFYYPYSTGASCADSHDEVDIELVTNFLQPGLSPLKVQLNRYAAEPLGAGHGPVIDLPSGFDPLAYHEWKIRWGISRLTYYVDDAVLFSTTTFVPQRPMHADMIVWGPGSDWSAAHDASLQPVSNAGANRTFAALVDRFTVRTVSVFTDSPLKPMSTVIRLDHLLELRGHVNAMRIREGLGEFPWRDEPAVLSVVLAQHLVELRTALAAVYDARGHMAPHYTDEDLAAGTVIKAVHMEELRAAVMAVE